VGKKLEHVGSVQFAAPVTGTNGKENNAADPESRLDETHRHRDVRARYGAASRKPLQPQHRQRPRQPRGTSGGGRTDAVSTFPFTSGKATDGATKSAVCSSCHGPNGNSVNPDWPRLAGQSAVYIAEQLRLFRSGVRNNPIMKPLAATLSDQDISDLAVYYEAQTRRVWRRIPLTGRPARRCT